MKKQTDAGQELIKHSLEWSNPHTQPPNGAPRVLVEEILPRNKPSRVVSALWSPGCGYASVWRSLSITPLRQLSAETKQGIRRKLLVRRVRHQAPLFADQLITQELQLKPDYYGME